VIDFTCNPLKCTTIFQRIQEWSFAGFKPDVLAERMGYDQYIRKQDRGIEAKPANRLQCNFSREFRRKNEIEKSACLFAQRPVFWQISPSLTHQPDWRRALDALVENLDQTLMHRGPSFSSSLI
jgi:hypothetical protein